MNPLRRADLGWHATALVLFGVALIGMLLDAAARRRALAEAQPRKRAVVRLLGTADFTLSSASRWLRHPSLTEPGAPFADGPAILDNDPAGAVIAPPRALLQAGWPRDTTIVIHHQGSPQ